MPRQVAEAAEGMAYPVLAGVSGTHPRECPNATGITPIRRAPG